MNLRISRAACAVGVAAAFTLVSLPAAAQQTGATRDTTVRDTMTTRTSQQRIPVRKDQWGTQTTTTTTTTSPGTVTRDTVGVTGTVGADTVGVTGTITRDTLGMQRDTLGMQRDTLGMPQDTTGMMRTDTVSTTTTTVPPATTTTTTTTTTSDFGRGRFGNGFYIGIAGGGTMPQGDFRDGYSTGWNITVPFGWQSMMSPWGIRGDVAYNTVNGRTIGTGTGSASLDDGQIWSAMLGLSAQWPVGARTTSFYVVGGGGVHHLRNFSFSASDGTGGSISVDSDNQTRFGLNGGAGIAFAIGAADLFVEGRYVSIFTRDENTNFIPVIVGLRFF